MFEQIRKQDPPSVGSGGAFAPFNQTGFAAVLSGEPQVYACGINVAWVNFAWSATPGIPIRMSAVEAVVEKTSAEPAALDLITVAVPDATYK
eukprot:5637661-Lingulodinium_polyedra.AAC.1